MSVLEHLPTGGVWNSGQMSVLEHLHAGDVWRSGEVPALQCQEFLVCGS